MKMNLLAVVTPPPSIYHYTQVKYFINMIRSNMLMNCAVKVEDINKSVNIFRPAIFYFQGVVRRKPISAKTSLIKILKRISKFYDLITLSIDILFVNNFPFLTTM